MENWIVLLHYGDKETITKITRLVDAASQIRHEWDIGIEEPTDASLKELFAAVKEIEDE